MTGTLRFQNLSDYQTKPLSPDQQQIHPGAEDLVFPLAGVFWLGRSPLCNLLIEDGSVSRLHAVMERRGDGYLLRDMQSMNGTTVNGVRIKVCLLATGDRIQLASGPSMVFDLDEEVPGGAAPEATPAAPRRVRHGGSIISLQYFASDYDVPLTDQPGSEVAVDQLARPEEPVQTRSGVDNPLDALDRKAPRPPQPGDGPPDRFDPTGIPAATTDEFLERVLDRCMEHLRCTMSFVVLRVPGSELFAPRLARAREGNRFVTVEADPGTCTPHPDLVRALTVPGFQPTGAISRSYSSLIPVQYKRQWREVLQQDPTLSALPILVAPIQGERGSDLTARRVLGYVQVERTRPLVDESRAAEADAPDIPAFRIRDGEMLLAVGEAMNAVLTRYGLRVSPRDTHPLQRIEIDPSDPNEV